MMRQGEFLVTKIHHVKGRIISKKLKENNIDEINPAQGRILYFLWQKDGVSLQELSKITALEKSTLTCMLDRLEDAGHVRRVPCETDRRKVLIYAGDKIGEKKAVFERVIKEIEGIFYKGFTDKEIKLFEEYLNRVLVNLLEYQGER